MRQFFTVRYWLTLLALGALVLVLWTTVGGGKATGDLLAPPDTTVGEQRVDLIAPVARVEADTGWGMQAGYTTADMRLILDANRTMQVKQGTAGSVECPTLAEAATCVVVADLLGDAVLWFTLLPAEPRPSITLPGIVALRDGNRVLLDNGWEVMRDESVELRCDDAPASLGEFVAEYGAASTSTFSFENQRVTRVTCLGSVGATTSSSSTAPATSVAESLPVGPVAGSSP